MQCAYKKTYGSFLLWMLGLATNFLLIFVLQTPVAAETMGTNDASRQDNIMGTFTEGMQLDKDEDGNTIIRSAPSPKDPPEQPETPPISIEVNPQIPAK